MSKGVEELSEETAELYEQMVEFLTLIADNLPYKEQAEFYGYFLEKKPAGHRSLKAQEESIVKDAIVAAVRDFAKAKIEELKKIQPIA